MTVALYNESVYVHRTVALVDRPALPPPLFLYNQLHPPADLGLLLFFLVSCPSMARLMAAPGFPSDLGEHSAKMIGKSLGVSL